MRVLAIFKSLRPARCWLAWFCVCVLPAAAVEPRAEDGADDLPRWRGEAENAVVAGDWKAALAAGDRLLAEARRRFGAEHSETARADVLLGQARQKLGELALAELHFRRALAAQQKSLGRDDPALPATHTHLATALLGQERFVEAAAELWRALELQREFRGAENPETALSARNLALLHRRQGDHARALPLREEAFSIRRVSFGADDERTRASLRELAETYAALRDLRAAEQCQSELERSSGESPSESVAAWQEVALFFESAGRWAAAAGAAERSHSVAEKRFGPGDSRTMRSVFLLARLCAAGGDFSAARLHLERLAPWFAQHPESDLLGQAEWRRQFALATLRDGEVADAETLFTASRKWHEAKLGRTHPATLRSLGDLWTFYMEGGQAGRALDPARELAARSVEALGEAAPATLIIFERLTNLCSVLGDRAEAASWFQRLIEGTRSRFGAGALETVEVLGRFARWTADDFTTEGQDAPIAELRNRAIALLAAGQSGAAPLLERALAKAETARSADTARLLGWLALARIRTGEFLAARTAVARLRSLQNKAQSDDATIFALQALIAFGASDGATFRQSADQTMTRAAAKWGRAHPVLRAAEVAARTAGL